MASLTNDLECLDINKKRDLGAIPKSASFGCVPGATSNTTPSTPSSVAKNRRNRRNRQRAKQINNNNTSASPNLLHPSPSASELSSTLSEDRRVPEIPEIPDLLPLFKLSCPTKICDNSNAEDLMSPTSHGNHNLESTPGSTDCPKVPSKKGSSRRSRRGAAGKRKKELEDRALRLEKTQDREKRAEDKESSKRKAFDADFPHIDESASGKFVITIISETNLFFL